MKINVYDYVTANNYYNEDHYWISIRDIGKEDYFTPGENTLVLVFDDTDPFRVYNGLVHEYYASQYRKRNPVYFTREMSHKCFDIARYAHSQRKDLNIHCFAGMSRSQAVAYVLNIYINKIVEDNDKDFTRNIVNSLNRQMVNPMVLNIMTETMIGIKE